MWWIIRKIITHLTAQNVSKLGIISPHYYGIDVYRFPATIHRVNIHAYISIWVWLSDISVDRSSTYNVCWHIRRIVRLILDGGKPRYLYLVHGLCVIIHHRGYVPNFRIPCHVAIWFPPADMSMSLGCHIRSCIGYQSHPTIHHEDR